MLKKVIASFLLINMILISMYSNICYAVATEVTQENLSQAIEEVMEQSNPDKDYQISLLNDVINVTSNNESYIIKYDLTGNPTFTFEMPIELGMSYEEFEKYNDNLMLPFLGYIAVANIQGVKVEDAVMYFMMSYMENAMNNENLEVENQYVIIDDLDTTDGITIEKTDDPNTIYTSEFGERVMEYVNAIYQEKAVISDADEINTYEYSIEKKDSTETSCKIIATLSVNMEADFSKISESNEELEDAFINKDITKDNADYVLKLKVGQTCKIKTTQKITGHSLYNSACIKMAEDYSEIVAIKAGITNGYLCIDGENKSIYIEVEENLSEGKLEEITLNIGNQPKEPAEPEKEQDTTGSNSKLPYAGISDLTFGLIGLLSILIFVIALKLKKYKDVK